LAISALVTTEGIAKANALNASGFLITIPTFSVSAVAGAIAATRTFASKNATFFTATVTSVAIASDTTVNYTCTIPAGSILAATAVLEIYLEDTATNTLYVVGQPEASTPIVVDPAGSTTIVISVTMSSIASSSYNLVNTSSTDLTNHESNLAMHPKTNYAATVAPTTADDAAAGYSEGSIWVDTVTNIGYVLLDKGNGAAVWGKIAPQSNGATNNFAAVTTPVAANDSTQGYSIGSVWVDTVTDQSYTLVDDTAGAAVWTQTTGGGSAGSVAAAVPTTPSAGDLWHNTANDLTYIYDGSAWIDIVNAGTGKAKNNYAATTAPTATDDSGAGYSRGSVWVDAVSGVAYTMVDSTAGAAVWAQTTSSGSGTTASATAPVGPAVGALWYDTVNLELFAYNGTSWVSQEFTNNYTATLPPTVTDDSSLGYEVGSKWVDLVKDEAYICTDSTAGAAVWGLITSDQVPIGGILGWGGSTAAVPANYLDASLGISVSQATYPELYAAIGDAYSGVFTATQLSTMATNGATDMAWHDTGTKLLLAVANYTNDVTGNINSAIYEVDPVTGVATQLSTIATNGAFNMAWQDTGTKLLLAVANSFNGASYNTNSVIYEVDPVTGVATQLSTIATNGALNLAWHDTGAKLLLAVSNHFNDVTFNINSVIYEVDPVTGVATQLSTIATSGTANMAWHDTGTKLLLAVANYNNGVTYNINTVIYEVDPVTGVATQLSTIATSGDYDMSWHDTGTKLLLAVANSYNDVTGNINSAIYEVDPVTGVATQLSTIATSSALSIAWHDTGTKLLLAVANYFNDVTKNINSVIYEVDPVTGVTTPLSTIATSGAYDIAWHDTGTKLLLAVANSHNDVTGNINSVIYEVSGVAPAGQFYLPTSSNSGIAKSIIRYQ